MREKVLLVDPPMQKFMGFSKSHMPLGLLYVAAQLQRDGHNVQVYDADHNPSGKAFPFTAKMEHYHDFLDGLKDPDHPVWGETREQIARYSPDVVGISVISPKLASGYRIAEMAKQMGVGKVIMGGPHATIDPDEVIANPYVDAVVTGEAENSINGIINGLDGIVHSTAITNLDDLAMPARSSLIGLDQNYSPNDLAMVMTSRGCPNACNYCCSDALWGRKVRFRSIDNVMEEIDSVGERFGATDFYVIDDTFSVSKDRVREFSDRMGQNDYSWSCLTRANKVDDEIASQMKDSGCRIVKVGLESGNEDVLRSMNKRSDLDDVRSASESFAQVELPWIAYLMFGVPGETEEQRAETLRFVNEVQPSYVSPSVFTPYPGTVFYEELGLGRIAYHEYNHHNPKGNPDITEDEVLNIAAWADKYNARHKN